ncbi:lysophospholipid acyltransferase family protein [Acinetobacter bereziniae]|uniref:lysophospholipid acyltransferase family protein n=1 Tax=Acinetobacter bereziniae TaxID=106648 RepID=UPI002812DA26|nr:lysophospholipid acyltransferase family protein [Acinetobacter bereziniae]MDQ9821188.1 lysophospholipid acyltransferase family protein [Acinetobacter bereziniae]
MTDKHKTITTRLLNFFSQLPIPVARFIARILAGLVNLLRITKTSETIRLNVEICFPELDKSQRERITEHAIRNELQSYMEFFTVWGGSNQKNIDRIHHIQGEHYFHDAIAAGKGLVLIVPHFGTWEVMNAWFAQYTQMTIMYEPIKDVSADDFVRAARSRENATLVPTDESGVRQIFRALKQGGTTVILPDHTPHQGGELIEYFGIPLFSSNLSAKLIQKTKAKALFLYAIRNDNQGFDMVIQPIDEEIYQVDANQGTRMIYQLLEQLICRYPEHYHWSYKRFKAHPLLKQIYNVPSKEAMEMAKLIRNGSTFSPAQPF